MDNLYILISVFVFIFGTIVGSFLNVVALRYGTGLPIARGRSQCFSCGKELVWYELVPVASFLFLGGACSRCKSKISWQYPLIEFITGVLFLLTFIHIGFSLWLAYYFTIWSLLIVISIYDAKHKIIPDRLVYAFGLIAFAAALYSFFNHAAVVLDLLAGPILAFPFAFLWLVSGGRWMGLGDAKLALGLGFFLGFVRGISALILAFWIGAAVSVVLMVIGRVLSLSSKNLTMKSEIPFGPFLILGTLIVFFFGFDVLGLSAVFGL